MAIGRRLAEAHVLDEGCGVGGVFGDGGEGVVPGGVVALRVVVLSGEGFGAREVGER